ncbi:MAG: uroporphyrinogen decarboxylase family protein [Spirochaetota bacterium]
MQPSFSQVKITLDWKGLAACIRRNGTPGRVFNMELLMDPEVKETLCTRFDLNTNLKPGDPDFEMKREIRVQRFLGYDYVRCSLDEFDVRLNHIFAEDTAPFRRDGGRKFIDEHKGPITNWEEFESYPWPDPDKVSTRKLEFYEANLPEDMCIIGSGQFAHFAEYLSWLMGYETLCYALFDQRDLVKAISEKLIQIYSRVIERFLAFDRVKIIWGSDDMGFRSATLLSPADLREFVLPGHRLMAEKTHRAGRPYLLHSCGNLNAIIEDLIDDIGIDAKHSFEDTIETVEDAKKRYGNRIALLGGIDVDFLCRSDETSVRKRVRKTLDACFKGGGYCLGTGNSVANYIPLDNYLAMLDEGRKYVH